MTNWSTDNPLALAWCAGLIDGEGCISISRRNMKTRHGKTYIHYAPSLHVNMVHLDTLRRLNALFGGSVYRHSRCTHTKKQAWTFGVTGQKAVAALRLLVPYMFAKREEAEAVISFYDLGRAWGGVNSKGIPNELTEARELLCRSVSAMKNREWPADLLGRSK